MHSDEYFNCSTYTKIDPMHTSTLWITSLSTEFMFQLTVVTIPVLLVYNRNVFRLINGLTADQVFLGFSLKFSHGIVAHSFSVDTCITGFGL